MKQGDYAYMKKGSGQWRDENYCRKFTFFMEIPCSNTSTVTQIAGLPSGSVFGTGTHTITYAAVDNATGATDTCSFTVTVGDCNPVYCNSYGGNSSYEWIERVKLPGIYDNISGNDGGYGDYTHDIIDLNVNQLVPIKLTPGFSVCPYFERWKVWIDWNRDGDFYDAQEKILWGQGYGNILDQFVVPTWADTTGLLRMRVSMRWGGWPHPCYPFYYGEVEDYSVRVTDIGLPAPNTKTSWSSTQGTNEPAAKDDLLEVMNLYPNPIRSGQELTIEMRFGQEETYQIEIINALGQTLHSENKMAAEGVNRTTIDLPQLSAGVYFVRVAGHNMSARFTVQ